MSPLVSIIMGSTSDLPVMEKAAQLLNDLHVPFEMNALSAHRTPEAVEEFAKGAEIVHIDIDPTSIQKNIKVDKQESYLFINFEETKDDVLALYKDFYGFD